MRAETQGQKRDRDLDGGMSHIRGHALKPRLCHLAWAALACPRLEPGARLLGKFDTASGFTSALGSRNAGPLETLTLRERWNFRQTPREIWRWGPLTAEKDRHLQGALSSARAAGGRSRGRRVLQFRAPQATALEPESALTAPGGGQLSEPGATRWAPALGRAAILNQDAVFQRSVSSQIKYYHGRARSLVAC